MDQKLKEAHENFVSGHSGSLRLEVILVVLPIVSGSYLAMSFSHFNKNQEM